jgi:hypothetical protein
MLLAMLARGQTSPAVRLATAVPGHGTGCAGAMALGGSAWQATGAHAPSSSCRVCQGALVLTGVAGQRVVSALYAETAPLAASRCYTGVLTRSAPTLLAVIGVVLAWLLGLRVALGPFGPSARAPRVRHGLLISEG